MEASARQLTLSVRLSREVSAADMDMGIVSVYLDSIWENVAQKEGRAGNPTLSTLVFTVFAREGGASRGDRVQPADGEDQEGPYYWSHSGPLPRTDPPVFVPSSFWPVPGRWPLKLTVPMHGRGPGAGHRPSQPTIHKSGTPSLFSTLSASQVTFLTHAADHVTPCSNTF